MVHDISHRRLYPRSNKVLINLLPSQRVFSYCGNRGVGHSRAPHRRSHRTLHLPTTGHPRRVRFISVPASRGRCSVPRAASPRIPSLHPQARRLHQRGSLLLPPYQSPLAAHGPKLDTTLHNFPNHSRNLWLYIFLRHVPHSPLRPNSSSYHAHRTTSGATFNTTYTTNCLPWPHTGFSPRARRQTERKRTT